MDYDDFYYEPSESEMAILDLKEHLRNEVKKEIIDKLEQLEKENKELQDIKKHKEKLEQDYKNKTYELEREYKEKERTLYKKPLKELIDIIQEEHYVVNYDWLDKPKCDKCNEQRQIELEDAYGRKHYVDCVCKEKYKSNYIVKPYYIGTITEIAKRDNKLAMWIKFTYEKSCWQDNDYISATYIDKNSIINDFDEFIQNNENVEEIKAKVKNKYYLSEYIFSKKEEAKKLADYANNLENKGE